MNLIHIDIGGKTARVGMTSLYDAAPKKALVQKTSAGTVSRVRVFNAENPGTDPFKLSAQDVIEGDPELAPSRAGLRLEAELSAAYINPQSADHRPVGDFQEIDIVYDATGSEKERRPRVVRSVNLNTIHPLKVSRRFPLAEALTTFVFKACFQLVHEDGLTMDFLSGLARELHERQEIAFLGAGPKGNQPLVTREKGTPYRAFLYGEMGEGEQANDYKLVLMLSDQELKRPQGA